MSILDDIDNQLDNQCIEDILRQDNTWSLINPSWGSSKYFSKHFDLELKHHNRSWNDYYVHINCIYFPSDYKDFYNISYLINDYKHSKIFTGIPQSLLYIYGFMPCVNLKKYEFLFKPENILDINTAIQFVKNYCKQIKY